MIEQAVRATASANSELVRAAARAEPKAWGALAARGIVAFRELAGRAPDDAERRAIWSGLWSEVRTRGADRGSR